MDFCLKLQKILLISEKSWSVEWKILFLNFQVMKLQSAKQMITGRKTKLAFDWKMTCQNEQLGEILFDVLFPFYSTLFYCHWKTPDGSGKCQLFYHITSYLFQMTTNKYCVNLWIFYLNWLTEQTSTLIDKIGLMFFITSVLMRIKYLSYFCEFQFLIKLKKVQT